MKKAGNRDQGSGIRKAPTRRKLFLNGLLSEAGVAFALEMADQLACGVIDSATLGVRDGREYWIDLKSIEPGNERYIEYAEGRKLLRYHPTLPNLVQVIEVEQ